MTSPATKRGSMPKPTWRQASGKHMWHILPPSTIVIRLAVSDKYIALSLDNKTIHVFSSAGDPVEIFRDQTEAAWSLALQDDVLLSGEMGGDIKQWDLDKGRLTSTLKGHTGTVRCIKFAPVTTAVSASKDGDIRIWNLETGACEGTLSGHTDTIYDLAIAGHHIISGGRDHTARVWSLSQRKEMVTLSGHSGTVWCVATGREKIITGGIDGDVRIWDLTTGECLWVLKGHTSMVSHIIIHGDLIFTGSADGRIIVWSLQDYSIEHKIEKAHEGALSRMDIRNGYMLTGGSDGSVKLWSSETFECFGDIGTRMQAVWGVSLGWLRDGSRSIVAASAQGNSEVEEKYGAYLDIFPLV